ncbi:TetR/AcrR family transcriptional regulator [Sciscionella marina]|uniref:TetR/AcrR family transcriptional regulator n=1 Tax=Sciscionella marina TaxID=508770 RepID=UPI00035C32C5|nr:TetR family transcriptional regulator [Sciscionella marina]
MPKIVDRDAVRRDIALALLRVLAEQGIEAVSVRTVAAAAGRSPGAVQKYFATKEELLTAAFELYCERSGDRIAAVPRGADRAETVTALVAATLPLDEQSRLDALVLHEFALRAAHEERIAARLRELDRDVLEELIAFTGLPAAAASALFAVSDGLAMRLLYGSQSRTEAMATLRTSVAAVLEAPEH